MERPLITVFLAFLDWPRNTLSYCRAGHPPPVVVRANSGPELAHEGGPVLGVLPSAEFASGTITFGPGDGLLAYSDGLSELRNVHGDEFGIGRLFDEVQVCERFSASQLLFSMLGIAKDFAGDSISDDDITMLALLRNNVKSRRPMGTAKSP
jgi:sigma-B regulation protein RsbU (phosphoserine phosphatase)